MSNYRRFWRPGGTYFFTLVAEGRADILTGDLARPILHDAIARTRAERPFDLRAIVLLPDHLHTLWELPEGDADFGVRLGAVKGRFTRAWRLAGGGERSRSVSRRVRGERGVWQRRFWEHVCRDVDDFKRHLDYIHWNPVKHGYVSCPHLWPWSTFRKWVDLGVYREDWRCACDGRVVEPFDDDELGELGE